MSILTMYLLLFILAVINFSAGAYKLKSFLSEYTSIRYSADLERFKTMVRLQMYLALLQIVILSGALVVGIIGILKDEIGLIVVLAMNGGIIWLGKAFKSGETRARTLPVDDVNLQAEYRDICRTWVRKPFPDF